MLTQERVCAAMRPDLVQLLVANNKHQHELSFSLLGTKSAWQQSFQGLLRCGAGKHATQAVQVPPWAFAK
jgi:hypothetical protein